MTYYMLKIIGQPLTTFPSLRSLFGDTAHDLPFRDWQSLSPHLQQL